MCNVFNHVISEEHFKVPEGCVYFFRGFKSCIWNLELLDVFMFPGSSCAFVWYWVRVIWLLQGNSFEHVFPFSPLFTWRLYKGSACLLFVQRFKGAVSIITCLCGVKIRILYLVVIITQITIRFLRIFWYEGQKCARPCTIEGFSGCRTN